MLVFTFLCVINQVVNGLTIDETLDFHINLAWEERTIFVVLDKVMKNDLTKNNPKDVNGMLSYLRQMETSAHK